MTAPQLGMSPKAARRAFSAALVAIGGLALCNWVLAPHLGYLHAMQRLEPVVERVAAEKDRIGSVLEARRGEWRTLQQEWASLREGVFTAQDARAFIRGLLPLVEETGCTIVLADFTSGGKTERVEEPNQPLAIAPSPVTVVARGEPEQVSVLLRRLGDHRPRIWIDSCRCVFPAGGTGPMECNLALTLLVVRDRPETADGDAAGPRQKGGATG